MFAFLVASAFIVSVHGRIPCIGSNVDDPKNRIAHGVDAHVGEFPFMVSIRAVRVNNLHFCGGTILTKNWVLTSAHCVRSPVYDFRLVSGSIDLDGPGVSHTVVKKIVHEEEGSKLHDIAIIRVEEPFKFTRDVQPVTLPKGDVPLESGENITAIGWGAYEPCRPRLSNRLKKGDDIIVISNKECQPKVYVEVFPGLLCTVKGVKQQGASFGDRGGPALKNGVQVAILSYFGKPEATLNARVSYYIDWIKDKLGPEADDLKFSE